MIALSEPETLKVLRDQAGGYTSCGTPVAISCNTTRYGS